jgi:hypothetical protein
VRPSTTSLLLWKQRQLSLNEAFEDKKKCAGHYLPACHGFVNGAKHCYWLKIKNKS